MWITQDEAVLIFARYCHARFGTSASHRVRRKAKLLEQRGDIEGHKIWTRVAQALDEKKKSRRSARTAA